MVDAAPKLMTLAEFLEWEDGTDTRYELVYGKVIALARPSAAHSVIMANIGAALRDNPKRRFSAGTTVGIIPSDHDDTFYVADLVASCTPLETTMVTIPQPVLIVEVLSPTTVEHDRGKVRDFRRIESVQEIALVASEQRRVEIWRRRGAEWEVEDLIGDAALELEAVGVVVPFAIIYADSGV